MRAASQLSRPSAPTLGAWLVAAFLATAATPGARGDTRDAWVTSLRVRVAF